MKREDFIDLITKKNFAIECPSIELIQMLDESNLNKYKGPGSIFLNDEGNSGISSIKPKRR